MGTAWAYPASKVSFAGLCFQGKPGLRPTPKVVSFSPFGVYEHPRPVNSRSGGWGEGVGGWWCSHSQGSTASPQ